MTLRRPTLMDNDKFVRMLAAECADNIFKIMANLKNYPHDPEQQAIVEELYHLARARYIEIRLDAEGLEDPDPLETDLWKCLISYELMRRVETKRNGLSTLTRRNIKKHGIK